MAKFKCLLFAQRLRRVPRQFRWVDPRRVRDGFIQRCDAPAAALCLLLITVADAQGLSDYGEPVDRAPGAPAPAQPDREIRSTP